MRAAARSAAACVCAVVVLGGCDLRRFSAPSREEVVALLQAEANDMKQGGEKMDPKLGVKAVWNIEGIDVVEQPNDSAHPWKGTVRFKIVSTMHDADGSETNDVIRKNFSYVYDTDTKKLLFQSSTTPPK
jgi:hypothetical protein